jgi:thioredoxin reductase
MVTARHLDLAIIGSGPAGLAAAVKAKQLGIKDVVAFCRNASIMDLASRNSKRN